MKSRRWQARRQDLHRPQKNARPLARDRERQAGQLSRNGRVPRVLRFHGRPRKGLRGRGGARRPARSPRRSGLHSGNPIAVSRDGMRLIPKRMDHALRDGRGRRVNGRRGSSGRRGSGQPVQSGVSIAAGTGQDRKSRVLPSGRSGSGRKASKAKRRLNRNPGWRSLISGSS
jgi:hypothetical protein